MFGFSNGLIKGEVFQSVNGIWAINVFIGQKGAMGSLASRICFLTFSRSSTVKAVIVFVRLSIISSSKSDNKKANRELPKRFRQGMTIGLYCDLPFQQLAASHLTACDVNFRQKLAPSFSPPITSRAKKGSVLDLNYSLGYTKAALTSTGGFFGEE